MSKSKIFKQLEKGANQFIEDLKTEALETKDAALIIQKYVKSGSISKEEEIFLKNQLIDSLKIIGIVIPFILIPGASIFMPFIIKAAKKHNIELLPVSNKNKRINKDNNIIDNIS